VGVGHIHVNASELVTGDDVAKKLSYDDLKLLREDLKKKKQKQLPAGDDAE